MRDLNLSASCVSNLVLDEWSAGELDAAQCAKVEEHLLGCQRCAQRRADFEREQHAFLEAAPSLAAHAALLGRELGPRKHARSPWPRRWLGATLAACAIALLSLFSAREQGTRSKGGGPHLGFFLKHGAQVSRGESGQTVQPGDLLRFTYSTESARYFALLNRDGRGASIYYPASGQATRVAPGAGVPLDFSVELDGSLGPERIYAVFCPERFELEPLRRELASSGSLHAPPDCQTDVIALVKEVQR